MQWAIFDLCIVSMITDNLVGNLRILMVSCCSSKATASVCSALLKTLLLRSRYKWTFLDLFWSTYDSSCTLMSHKWIKVDLEMSIYIYSEAFITSRGSCWESLGGPVYRSRFAVERRFLEGRSAGRSSSSSGRGGGCRCRGGFDERRQRTTTKTTRARNAATMTTTLTTITGMSQ